VGFERGKGPFCRSPKGSNRYGPSILWTRGAFSVDLTTETLWERIQEGVLTRSQQNPGGEDAYIRPSIHK
jgi:hypothetical protein